MAALLLDRRCELGINMSACGTATSRKCGGLKSGLLGTNIVSSTSMIGGGFELSSSDSSFNSFVLVIHGRY